MMNSIYEFDQPLDLRLKALNLSIGTTYQKQEPTSDISTNISFNESNILNSRTVLTNHSSSVNPVTTDASPIINITSNQFINQPNLAQYRAPISHNYMLNQPLSSSSPTTLANAANNDSLNISTNRSTNIHCQPLNHHQPHPLSRLHPTPNHIQSQQQQNNPQNLRQPQAHSAPAISYINLPNRQDSPATKHPYQPVIMKSLSVSSHHHLPSPSFSNALNTTQSQLFSSHPSNLSCISVTNNQQQQQQHRQPIDFPQQQQQQQQQTIQFCSTVNQSQARGSSFSNASTQLDLNNSSTSSCGNNQQQQVDQPLSNNNNNNNSASPITRQHSLVSRYNCKPCGIVFSQPETLRAHQEGYCTKRDRAVQTQDYATHKYLNSTPMNRNNASYSSSEELASSLKTDLSKGLDWSECETRLRAYGLNEFNIDESSKILTKYLEQFRNPLIQLLLASVVISVFMGQYDDAISITLAILIVITVAFVQEYRSEKSLKELNKLVPPTCKAIRAGKHEDFLAKYLVPGDVVVISMGDRVPADLRLIECHSLSIDESNLTGETEPSSKTSSTRSHSALENGLGDSNNNSSDKQKLHSSSSTFENLAFMGTLVQSGHGKGIVLSTGQNTQFGVVFQMMQAEEAPKSPLQVNMDQLGQHLSLYSICIIAVIVFIGWLQSRPLVEMFTIGVSLAVAAIPEGLPIVVAVTLALGVMRMANRKAVVKQLPAVETLGCLHIVCSDKTGTLTKNEMTVTRITTSESFMAKVTGVGYEEIGEVILDNLDVDQSSQIQSIKRLLGAATICNNARFDSSGKLIGQPTEGAMLVAAKKVGLTDLRDEHNRLEEIPFNSAYKYMAVKCSASYQITGNVSPNFFVKGAMEVILDKCLYYSNSGTSELLSDSYRQDLQRQSELIESQGLRVLALASGSTMENLVFLGFLGILDAPRPGVKEAIEVLQDGGIQIKMVTGDSKLTAQSIAKMVGISGSIAMSGFEIDELLSNIDMREQVKAERLANVSVFYRVTPHHKVTIVKMLQSLGYVTAMTGDGVNDGVALKKANIGIAMGTTGTDVCKEAADVILMDDNLATIVVALEEGKGIFYNIRNFIKFQLSTSIAALSLIALSTILHIPNPLNAMQILYINILMDGPPAQSLGVEKVDPDVLKQPPRNVKEPVLTRELLISVLVSASIILCGTLIVFISEMSDGVVTPRDTTMTFTCFVLFDLFNALSCRSQTKSIFELGFFTNKAFLYAVGGSLVGQLLVIYCPPFQAIFQTEALSLVDILFLLTLSSTVFFASEAMKLFKSRIFKRKLLHGTSIYLV